MKKKSESPIFPIIGIDRVRLGFRNKKILEKYPNVHEFKEPIVQVLWILWVIKEEFELVDYVPPEWISEILIDEIRIPLSSTKVQTTLEKEKNQNLTFSRKVHEQPFYKIMEKGINYINEVAGKSTIYKIGGNTPSADKKFLTDIIKESKGEIKILDPYYGIKTLDNLRKFNFGKQVKLLTATLSGKKSEFNAELADFKKENPNVEIRTYPNKSELHDRYIITKTGVIFTGHGIKDIGGKESFILIFEKKAGKNILDDLNSSYNNRWKISTPI